MYMLKDVLPVPTSLEINSAKQLNTATQQRDFIPPDVEAAF